jgi:signal transduction histidine kinase
VEPKKALIVEDEFFIAKNIKQILDKNGYEVAAIVASGKKAIEQAVETRPHIILMDIKLKGDMDGIETAQNILALCDIPIVYMTAYSDKNIIERAKITEPFGYLIKPVNEVELILTIEMALYKHKIETHLKEMNKSLERQIAEEVKKNRQQEQLLIQQSKMAAIGEMIGAIAHQWRQPLNIISLIIQSLKYDFRVGEVTQEYIANVESECMKLIEYMATTIDDFRNLFKPSKVKADFNVISSIQEAVVLFSSHWKEHNIEIQLRCNHLIIEDGVKIPCAEMYFVNGYQNEFKQVVLNIVNNAKDAIIEKRRKKQLLATPGEIVVDVFAIEDRLKIEISDNGGGIPLDIMDKIFEPYYTTKENQGGSGIGLYMSKMIIENNMDGKLYAGNRNNGAVFTIEMNRL